MNKVDKNRAKLAILNYIITRCKSIKYGNEKYTRGGFDNDYFKPEDKPIIGDLVSLTSAPATEWYLSWYIDFIPQFDHFSHIHVLESIETGRLCNWRNVGFNVLCRKVVDLHPEWKWTDKQYEFKDRWFRACYKKRNAYMTLPTQPVFHNGGGVTIGTRKRFGWGSFYKKKFVNWKKVLVRDMLEFYDSTIDPN